MIAEPGPSQRIARPAAMLPPLPALPFLVALPLLLALAACEDAAGPNLRAGGADEIVVAFGQPTDAYPSDDWDLVSGELEGDTLVLRIQHAGGCRDHEYWLLAVDDWIRLPDAGPTPTYGVPLRLAHEAHGDPCEALLSPTLRFGLGPLRAAFRSTHGPGPARLLLQITDGRDGFAIHVFDWRVEG